MKSLSIKLLFLVAVLNILVSCNDWVDFDPKEIHQIDASVYFGEEADYQAAVVGTYDPLQWLYLNILIGDIASDNSYCGGESATDVIGLQQIDNMTHTPSNDNLTNVWRFCFEGINRANYLEENKNKINFSGKDALYGEVYFLRAYYYFELVKFFGGVPLFTESRATISDIGSYTRATQAEIYAQIETDLQNAIAVLPDTPSQKGRASKYAAQALLGKAYLFQDKFSEAATVLQNVIGNFTLVSNFESQFLKAGENGTESVFEVQHSNESDWWDWAYVPQGTEGNYGVIHNGPRADITGFARGWSFNIPTQDLVDAFEDGDSRKEATILSYTGDVSTLAGYEQTGYFNKKYAPRSGESGAQTELNYLNNYRAIRYADVLLMAAEANVRGSGNTALAQQYLDEVRDRAFGDADHRVTATAESIWNERRLELAMEGHRFFDLVRTGQAASVIMRKHSEVNATTDNTVIFTTGKNEVFPVPQQEIDISGLTQNSGY